MTDRRILIACIGNIFLGDDGFGVDVARRLMQYPMPPGVVLKDFGIRGVDLTYALLDPWDLVVLVDACPRGGEPGDVYVIEPDLSEVGSQTMDAHGMNPASVLRAVKSMGGAPNRILLVGCEPADLGSDEEGRLGLTEPVSAAVDRAITVIGKLIGKALGREPMEAAA